MMRKICFRMLLLSFFVLSHQLCAQTATLTVVSASGERGTSGNAVEVSLDNSINLQHISFTVEFDSTILHVTSAHPGGHALIGPNA
ncbi:MAG: hypothetical protein ACE5OR_10145, partial [bacterium]